jgi:FKBP-type peptidyl-prolyl cis-trans isomerase FkpA
VSFRLLIAYILVLPLIAACGGSNQPAEHAPPAQKETTPAPQASAPPPAPDAARPPDMPAAPPNTVGPAGTPPPAPPPASAAKSKPLAPEKPAFTRTDLKVGGGREAVKGSRIQVHYSGWLYDPASTGMKGRMFDTSQERGPFDLVLGAGQVIPGWDQGIVGMKVGGRRRLIIPSDLAYGVDGAGNGIIPPNATLLFEVELLDVQ